MKIFLTILVAAMAAIALADVSSLAPQNTFDLPPPRPDFPPSAHPLIMQFIANAAQQHQQSQPPPPEPSPAASAQQHHDHAEQQHDAPYPPAQKPAPYPPAQKPPQPYLPPHAEPQQPAPYPPAQKPPQQYLPPHAEPQQPAPYPPAQRPPQQYLPPTPEPQQPAAYLPAQRPPQQYLPPQPAPYPPAQRPSQQYLPPQPEPQQQAPYPPAQKPAQQYLPPQPQPTSMAFPMPGNYLPPAQSAPARSNRRFRPRAKIPKKAMVTKNFFIHSAPEESDDELQDELKQLAQQPRKHYNVLFVKTPAQTSKAAAVNLAKALKEEKTVVYVLSKKTTASDLQEAIAEAPQQLNKPEVFFIKYRTPEEAANAQRQIQSQYDSLGGTSIITDEGYSPVTSVVGSLDAPEEDEDIDDELEQEPEPQQYDEQLLASINSMGSNHYLPPNHY